MNLFLLNESLVILVYYAAVNFIILLVSLSFSNQVILTLAVQLFSLFWWRRGLFLKKNNMLTTGLNSIPIPNLIDPNPIDPKPITNVPAVEIEDL